MINYGQRPFSSAPMYNADYRKYLEKYNLRKRSSGLGFFIFVYFILLYGISIFTEVFLLLFNGNTDKVISDLTGADPVTHYFYIFTATTAMIIAAVFYLGISKNKASDCIKVKPVKASLFFPIIFIGLALAMVANIATDWVSTNFSYFGIENTADLSDSSGSMYMNILNVIATAIVPALAEEFAFRGVLMGVLRRYGDAFAIITSAVVFGAFHGNIVQIPFAFMLGLIFAYADCKTNSIIPSVAIHFFNNFYAVIINILNTDGVLSDKAYFMTYFIIVASFCVLAILSCIYLLKKHKDFFSISDNSPLSLSLKEKNICFFTNPGVILSLSVLLLETISHLGIIV